MNNDTEAVDPAEMDLPVDVLEEGPVDPDEIPPAYDSARALYFQRVQQVVDTGQAWMIVVNEADHHTARSGIRRAIKALDREATIKVTSRSRRDNTCALFITPIDPDVTTTKE